VYCKCSVVNFGFFLGGKLVGFSSFFSVPSCVCLQGSFCLLIPVEEDWFTLVVLLLV